MPRALAQKQIRQEISAMDALLALRDTNRRMTLEQYLEKIGLREKFEQFRRKQDS